MGRQGSFLTMLLDIVPNAVSHLRCEALLSHHLILYFLPGHLGRQRAVRDLGHLPHHSTSMGPPQGAVLEQKLLFSLHPKTNFSLVCTKAAPPQPSPYCCFPFLKAEWELGIKESDVWVITLSSLSTDEQMVRNLLSGTPQIANIPSRMRRSFTCRDPKHLFT